MGGRPFRSKLQPFYNMIVSLRTAGKTWEEIAQAIRDKGVPCTRQAVQDYFKRRRRKLRIPMGMEPATEEVYSSVDPTEINSDVAANTSVDEKAKESLSDRKRKQDKESRHEKTTLFNEEQYH